MNILVTGANGQPVIDGLRKNDVTAYSGERNFEGGLWQVGTPTCAGDLASIIYKVIEENQLYKEGDLFGDRGMRPWSRFVKDIYELSSNIFDIQACRNGKFPSKVKRFPFFVLDNTRRKSLFGITVFLLKGS